MALNAVELIHANPDDIGSIQDCVNAAYGHYVERMGKPPGPMLDDYTAHLNDDELYVVKEDGVVVAVLVLIRSPDQFLLDNIAVHPSLQGKGMGKRLMDFAEKRALGHGFNAIDLYTHEVMIENLDLYKKWGYVVTQRRRVNGYDRIYMRKDL